MILTIFISGGGAKLDLSPDAGKFGEYGAFGL